MLPAILPLLSLVLIFFFLAFQFHTRIVNEILFNGWVTTNGLELFGSCVAIFLAGVVYEGLKYYR